jgi:hypothetical protein
MVMVMVMRTNAHISHSKQTEALIQVQSDLHHITLRRDTISSLAVDDLAEATIARREKCRLIEQNTSKSWGLQCGSIDTAWN